MSSEQRRRLERLQGEQGAPQPSSSVQVGQPERASLQRRRGERQRTAAAGRLSGYRLEWERKQRDKLHESGSDSSERVDHWRAAGSERNGLERDREQLVQTAAERASQLVEWYERVG